MRVHTPKKFKLGAKLRGMDPRANHRHESEERVTALNHLGLRLQERRLSRRYAYGGEAAVSRDVSSVFGIPNPR